MVLRGIGRRDLCEEVVRGLMDVRDEHADRRLLSQSRMSTSTVRGLTIWKTYGDEAGRSIAQGLLDELRQDLREVRCTPADRPVVLRLRIQIDSTAQPGC